jgi:hypothetical protein
MITSSLQKTNHVNPLEPTAWPTLRSHGPISLRPHLPIALFYLLYGLPETSVFPASYTVEVIRWSGKRDSLIVQPTLAQSTCLFGPLIISQVRLINRITHFAFVASTVGFGHPGGNLIKPTHISPSWQRRFRNDG